MILGGLSSRVDDVTPPDRRPHARGLDAATYNIAEIAGPAAGAWIAASLGSVASVVLAGAALTASAVLVTFDAPRIGGGTSRPSVIEDLRAGLRTVRTRPALRSVTAAACLAAFGSGAHLDGVLLASGPGTRRPARPAHAHIETGAPDDAGRVSPSLPRPRVALPDGGDLCQWSLSEYTVPPAVNGSLPVAAKPWRS